MISIMEEKKPSEIGEEILSAKKSYVPISPGPCSPRGCPPPREIVCIKTKKVYQECKQVEPIERVKVYGLNVPPGACDVECIKVTPAVISCEDVSQSPGSPPHTPLREEDRGKKKKLCACECEVGEGTVTLGEIKDFPIQITVEFYDRNGISLGCQTGWAKICIDEKTVLLSRAGEPQLKCEVDIFLACLMCSIQEFEPNAVESPQLGSRFVWCCINKVIVFKLLAEVQLLVPSYGFCPEPPECEGVEEDECPEAEEMWPPYPGDKGGGGCRSCK